MDDMLCPISRVPLDTLQKTKTSIYPMALWKTRKLGFSILALIPLYNLGLGPTQSKD